MKTILLTGATDGIGLAAAQKLVSKGHRVLIHGRNPNKVKQVAQSLGLKACDNEQQTFVADLSNFQEVYQMTNQIRSHYSHIDVLVNNAGVYKLPAGSTTSNADGMDMRIAVNTVAPYVLTKELLPLFPKNGGRVINLSSAAQAPVDFQQALPTSADKPARIANDFEAYSQSKLAVIMWTNLMASMAAEKSAGHNKISFLSLNPASMIGTKMVKEGWGVEGKSLDVGADIIVETAVGKKFGDFSQVNGQYFDNDRRSFGRPHPAATNMQQNEAFVQAMDDWLMAHGYASCSTDRSLN